ncbi:MAG: DUF1501 domain-containing protein [Verrucomicrobiales bacterium]
MIQRLSNYNPVEHPVRAEDLLMNRRSFLQRTGMGFGALGLSALLGELAASTALGASSNPLTPKTPPLPAKAKAVIHIFAEGGPSQIDTWDPKPALAKFAGKTLPGLDGIAFASPFKFEPKGKSGIPVSDVFPQLGEHVDDMCVIRSMFTDIPAHDVAQRFMNTGSAQLPKPSVGSWVLYGLGSLNQNMPGFITIGGKPEWRQASFLPGVYQGVNVNYRRGMPLDQVLLNIRNQFTGPKQQRAQLDLAQRLNQIHAEKLQRDDQLEARIEAFEMAFKMQIEATHAFDISKESAAIRSQYGVGELGAKLLVARRLVERGVRFVQVSAGGWDHHQRIEDNLPARATDIDQPAAALLADLKQRGLLGSTLVIWGGEFGRTVTRDRNGNEDPGRDHNARGFSMWLAGGGVRGGHIHGATDEFGARAVQDKVHVHDLHATILALLGFDHTNLIHRYNGRDFRLTDNYGSVVRQVIA